MNSGNSGNDQLDRNVERLLSRTRPAMRMPEEGKKRVLSALKTNRRLRWRRGIPWTAAAAAAAIITFLFWPWGMSGGIAWADVAKQLNTVGSMSARVVTESMPGTGAISEIRLFQKDPGLSRSEMLGSDGEPVSIVIMNSGRSESSIARISPRDRTVHITTLTFSGAALDSRAAMPRDIVADSWSRLKIVTSDQTKEIGNSEIGGVPVVGFEIDIREIFEQREAARMTGLMRVWADAESGVPLEVGAEFTDPGGTEHITTFTDIEWNPPLADDLFVIPEADSWTIRKESVEEVGFTHTSLRDDVTFSLGPAGGEAVVTEADVAAVRSGKVVALSGKAHTRMQIMLKLRPDAAERLHSYSSTHLGERTRCDFNGEIVFEPTIGGIMSDEVLLDVTELGLTPEQFETEYLE
jgi:outer membrane lipoprotein-sorting protein